MDNEIIIFINDRLKGKQQFNGKNQTLLRLADALIDTIKLLLKEEEGVAKRKITVSDIND